MDKPEIALYNCSNLVAPCPPSPPLPYPPLIHSTFAFISRFSIAPDTMVQWRDNITSKSPGIVRTITPARVILNCIRPWPRSIRSFGSIVLPETTTPFVVATTCGYIRDSSLSTLSTNIYICMYILWLYWNYYIHLSTWV